MTDWRDGFVQHLQRLSEREDRAALAILRRGLRDQPELNFEAAKYVYPALPNNLYPANVKDAFLVAALYALHPLGGGQGNLGVSVSKITGNSANIEKRFLALVDSDKDSLPTKLRHMTTLLKANSVPIAWAQLLKDLSSWEHPDKWVQRKWVNEFYTKEELK